MSQLIEIDKPLHYTEAKEAGMPVFKVFSDTSLKAYTAGDGAVLDDAPRIKFSVSSTVADLIGDVISEACLYQMKEQAIGKTFFANHRYEIPQDVIGYIEGADIVYCTLKNLAGEDENAVRLDFVVRIATTNPAAMKTYELVKTDGVKLGASIGFLIVDAVDTGDSRRLINSLYFLECSAVGIPMSQTSWVQNAHKALKSFNSSHSSEKAQPAPQPVSEARIEAKKPQTNNQTRKAPNMKQTKKLRRKGIFDDVLADASTATIGGLAQALGAYLQQLLDSGDPDAQSQAEAALDEFSNTVMTFLTPALEASQGDEEPDGDEGTGEAGDNDGDEGDGDDTEEAPEVKAAKRFLRGKALRKKDFADPDGDGTPPVDADGDGDHDQEDDEILQNIHDSAVTLGAMCHGITSYDLDMPMSLGAKSATRRMARANKELQKQLATLKAERDEAIETASLATQALEAFSKRPLAL